MIAGKMVVAGEIAGAAIEVFLDQTSLRITVHNMRGFRGMKDVIAIIILSLCNFSFNLPWKVFMNDVKLDPRHFFSSKFF